MFLRLFTLLFLGGCLLGSAHAQDAYTLKAKESVQGTTMQVQQKESTTRLTTITPANGNKVEQVEKSVENYVYVEEIIARPAGATRPTDIKRKYSTAEVVKNDKAIEVGYHEKTLLIQKLNDKYQFFIDGKGELRKDDVERLDRQFNRSTGAVTSNTFLPKQAVKVGETWTVDLDTLIKDLAASGLVVDAKTSTGSTKLVKVYEQDKLPFAQVDIALKFSLQETTDRTMLKFKPGSEMKLNITVDFVRDGSREYDITKATNILNATTVVGQNTIQLKTTSERSGQRVEILK